LASKTTTQTTPTYIMHIVCYALIFWCSLVSAEEGMMLVPPDDGPMIDPVFPSAVYPPDDEPTDASTIVPSAAPTNVPTIAPSAAPTDAPTAATDNPTDAPTAAPTGTPSAVPSDAPTDVPTAAPTTSPSAETRAAPTSPRRLTDMDSTEQGRRLSVESDTPRRHLVASPAQRIDCGDWTTPCKGKTITCTSDPCLIDCDQHRACEGTTVNGAGINHILVLCTKAGSCKNINVNHGTHDTSNWVLNCQSHTPYNDVCKGVTLGSAKMCTSSCPSSTAAMAEGLNAWYMGGGGQSCDQACSAKSLICDVNAYREQWDAGNLDSAAKVAALFWTASRRDYPYTGTECSSSDTDSYNAYAPYIDGGVCDRATTRSVYGCTNAPIGATKRLCWCSGGYDATPSSTTPAPTDAPTEVPTDAPTDVPTDAPTDVPSAAPTHAPTSAPTSAPTRAPTSAPGAWVVGGHSESCDDACSANGGACDEAAYRDHHSDVNTYAEISALFESSARAAGVEATTCATNPHPSGWHGAGAPEIYRGYSGTSNWCYWPNDEDEYECNYVDSSQPEQHQRLCWCTGASPTGAPTDAPSAASAALTTAPTAVPTAGTWSSVLLPGLVVTPPSLTAAGCNAVDECLTCDGDICTLDCRWVVNSMYCWQTVLLID
jgi:hypothetical protein